MVATYFDYKVDIFHRVIRSTKRSYITVVYI